MTEKEKAKLVTTEKRKAAEETEDLKKDLKKVKNAYVFIFNLKKLPYSVGKTRNKSFKSQKTWIH
jgi:hypothetical protein